MKLRFLGRLIPLLLSAMAALTLLSGCGDEAAQPEAFPAPPTENLSASPPLPSPEETDARTASPPAFLVNGRPVTKSTFDNQVRMRFESQQYDSADDASENSSAEPSPELARAVFNDLVSLEVAIEEAMSLGYAPADEELRAAVDEVAEDYGGPEELSSVLSFVGETMDSFRVQLRRTLAVKNWRETHFLSQSRVSNEEAKEFYDANIETFRHQSQVRALQIMVPVPMIPGRDAAQLKAEAKTRAEEILKEAKDGAKFEDLIESSMDMAAKAATNGGRLGWINLETGGFPELVEAVSSLKPGEVGELVESDFSFHVVKVLERRQAGVTPFTEARPEILIYLANAKIDDAMQERIAELRREAKVEVTDPSLAEFFLLEGSDLGESATSTDEVQAAETPSPPEEPRPAGD